MYASHMNVQVVKTWYLVLLSTIYTMSLKYIEHSLPIHSIHGGYLFATIALLVQDDNSVFLFC